MAKKTDVPVRRKGPWVVDAKGLRQPFLRGMVTHDLIERGLSFDDAYAIARVIRDRLEERDEVTPAEIRDLLSEQIESQFGAEVAATVSSGVSAVVLPEAHVLYRGQKQPFSRGVLARSIYAAGLTLDRAYRLVAELEKELQEEGVQVLPSSEVARRVDALLERFEGKKSARRYRLVRRIHRLPKPLVVYIGGASGTGKSTLALELAPLLRMYRINATDTIRQVMRMVFSPAILPALHTSSFEVAPAFGHEALAPPADSSDEPEFRERLIATYEEQATRVGVGVRAVVERAIAENMSVLVEGVHLAPTIIPFADLGDQAFQVALILGTLDRDHHRARFLLRSHAGGRQAERYVDSFPAIRIVHDHLLELAELHDVPLLDNSSGDPPVVRALRVFTSVLQKQLPSLARTERDESRTIVPTLLLTIDSLADRPAAVLKNRTPLQAANTPTLDRLAREGQSGLSDPVAPDVVSDMASGTLALFGHPPASMKRGPIEAMGAGISLAPGDVAFRANLATINKKGRIVDRRAELTPEEVVALARALDRVSLPEASRHDVEVRVQPTSRHRLAVVLRGEGLSSDVQGSDPGGSAGRAAPKTPLPLEAKDARAVRTAAVLAAFEKKALGILEEHPVNVARKQRGDPAANGVLTRGAGRAHRLLPPEHSGIPLRVTCISGDPTMLALAAWLGAETVTKEGMTGGLDTAFDEKLAAAREALRRSELVVLHLHGADVAGRQRRPDWKVDYLEKLDESLGHFLASAKENTPLRVVVASDHATLSESGDDVADPLPVLIWGEGFSADEVERFDEASAAKGVLKRFPLQSLLGKLFDLD